MEGHWQMCLGALGPPRGHVAQNEWDWKLPERDNEELSLRAGVPKPQATDKYWSLAY